ncbi:alpha/beta hydrolase [Lysobacter sp. KIS68-7]|uniref:alpha/beta fold hydrolase n=1 Tax=Lysobacter sp. KIS68-7 TaxID=2904252 RepID=UPI001E36F428|nr:alpha/beta hydrolase [Lysobacter sp. KIS68-7]UHQ18326.1 alpha/beta hydrolase [Lysobacter sp. KIS68-7]
MRVPTHILSLPGDGKLAYSLYGAPNGRPVHFFHGFPNSRLFAAMVHRKAAAAGVCLVAADRPGFGASSAMPGRSLMDWSTQVEALADHLGHSRFDVIGVSCGGAYALACAAQLPHRIGRVALLAGMGPMDRPEIRRTQMPALKAMFGLAKLHPWLASPMFLLDRSVFRGDPDRALRMVAGLLTPPDRAVLDAEPDVGRHFVASMAEAYRQGIGAAMQEARLIAQPRPYRLEDIRVPAHVFQGGADRHVPETMGRYLARTIPSAHWHLFPEEGHLSIVWNRFDECLAVLGVGGVGYAGHRRGLVGRR